MTLRITCPACQTSLKLGDDMRGRKVRCTNCDKGLNIPAANGNLLYDEEEEQDEQEERPAKKKKKKKNKKGAPVGLLVGIGVGVLLLLIVGGAATTVYLVRDNAAKAPPGPAAQNKDGNAKGGPAKDAPPDGWVPAHRIVVPGIKEGNPAKTGGGSITGNIRGAAFRAERRNELRQIGLFFQQFCDGTPKSARTKENFLNFMQRDSKAIHEAISDGYYVMNMRADVGSSSSIIAYERDIDRTGHLCVMGDTSVDYVPLQVLKDSVGK